MQYPNIKTSFSSFFLLSALVVGTLFFSCQSTSNESELSISAKDILGNKAYQAISFGGYRHTTRDSQPSVEHLKEDMKILSALNIKLLRTYNVSYPHAENVLKAIRSLKKEDKSFEMYVMLGAWISCADAFTDKPNHKSEHPDNEKEILKAIELTNTYSDIVKVIAVGNEAMVKWQTNYFVHPRVILKWVNYLQKQKENGLLPQDLWITSSDNFASWGGGSNEYHVPALDSLIHAVDFISLHTYPMHDTHHNPDFWGIPKSLVNKSKKEKIDYAMDASLAYAQKQYNQVKEYVHQLGIEKPIHIGETGWANSSNSHYGKDGSKACDEYKQSIYHQKIRKWTNEHDISCFYFEAFDEPWKDALNPLGSENHFGLINIQSEAKYMLWSAVDKGIFDGLRRDNKPITKTFGGNLDSLMLTVSAPPLNEKLEIKDLQHVDKK